MNNINMFVDFVVKEDNNVKGTYNIVTNANGYTKYNHYLLNVKEVFPTMLRIGSEITKDPYVMLNFRTII